MKPITKEMSHKGDDGRVDFEVCNVNNKEMQLLMKPLKNYPDSIRLSATTCAAGIRLVSKLFSSLRSLSSYAKITSTSTGSMILSSPFKCELESLAGGGDDSKSDFATSAIRSLSSSCTAISISSMAFLMAASS